MALVNHEFGRYNEKGELQDVNERGILGAIVNAIKEMFSWLQMQHSWNADQDIKNADQQQIIEKQQQQIDALIKEVEALKNNK